ncbi:uncharacterized protein DUF4192 [Rhodococcus sp. AG1013]|uniref:DUF4192 domain-containing protein n=1 Tax=Rhodococcus sp. AG1013 TaxID=2183996 RepID=UPI000E0C226B|nr:DUF4192 domain-containing protein [Rhodococcus sp. AG1013]RDI31550.1 uncharacterized protein DUF4192 [Rhodococcus sp. AG1013]
MTTPAFSHDSPRPHNPALSGHSDLGTPNAVRISDPGDLISAVPALLGFHPRRSLVAICLTGTSVGAVMRHDLVLHDPAGVHGVMELVLDQFAAVSIREGADRVLVVVVDDRIPPRARSGDLWRHSAIVDRFRELLCAGGTELAAAHLVPRIEAGAQWRDLVGHSRGVLPDPAASEVAAAQVFGGRAIRGSREELEAVLDPVPAGEQACIAEIIDAAREASVRGVALAHTASDPAGVERAHLERVLARIAALDSGDEITAHECADMALALENPHVRDALLALTIGERADAAEQMWIHLGRSLPDPERAEPLALLGYSSYVRGDGPMAGVALCAALAADPCHRLANLLDDALQAGIRPDALRDLADLGYEVAQDLGVQLPPRGGLSPRGV